MADTWVSLESGGAEDLEEAVAVFTSVRPRLFVWDDVDLGWTSTNGQTSVVVRHGGDVRCMFTISATAEGIDRVLWMFNPEKITAVSGRT